MTFTQKNANIAFVMTIEDLPAINATLNGLAAILLCAGWVAIKRGQRKVHRHFMASAFTVSAIFLCSYLTYHFNVTAVTKYQGEGFLRGVYFFILISHILLAMVVPPASLLAVYFAIRKQFTRHVRVTKWLWPVWMYVSVTGVTIYVMLYIL